MDDAAAAVDATAVSASAAAAAAPLPWPLPTAAATGAVSPLWRFAFLVWRPMVGVAVIVEVKQWSLSRCVSTTIGATKQVVVSLHPMVGVFTFSSTGVCKIWLTLKSLIVSHTLPKCWCVQRRV